MTLDIQLVGAQCPEVHGTAITVAVQPSDAEDRLNHGYVTSSTNACDGASIGTLVVTPGPDGRGAARRSSSSRKASKQGATVPGTAGVCQ